jgi:chromosome segregation ATPase
VAEVTAALTAKIEQKTAKLDSLEARLSAIRAANTSETFSADMAQQLGRQAEAAANSRAAADAAAARVTELSSELAQLRRREADITASFQEQLAAAQREIEKLTEANTLLIKQIKAKRRQYAAAAKDRDALRSSVAGLQSSEEKLRNKATKRAEALQQVVAERDDVFSRYGRLLSELAAVLSSLPLHSTLDPTDTRSMARVLGVLRQAHDVVDMRGQELARP